MLGQQPASRRVPGPLMESHRDQGTGRIERTLPGCNQRSSQDPQAGGLTKGSDGGPRAAALSAFYVCDLILPAEVEKRVIGIAALIQGWNSVIFFASRPSSTRCCCR